MATQLNRTDCKYEALAHMPGDHINERFLAWLQSNGASSKNISDCQMQFLRSRGYRGHVNDMWFNWLGDLGYVGSLADRWYQFWCIGDGVNPPGTFPGAAIVRLPLRTDRYAVPPGVYDATMARNSIAQIDDHQGLIRVALPNEMRFRGARRVHNKTPNGNIANWNFTDSSITQIDANSLTFHAGNNMRFSLNILSRPSISGVYALMSAYIWVEGNQTIAMRATGGQTAGTQGDIIINQTRRKIRFPYFSDSWDGTSDTNIYLRTVASYGVDVIVHFEDVQIEERYQTEDDIPSEYVTPNDSASSEGDIAVRYYDTLNGNSVTPEGVVSYGVGSPFEVPGLFIEESTTNTCENSHNLINWSHDGTNSSVFNRLEENTANSNHRAYTENNAVILGQPYTFSGVFKADDATWIRLAFGTAMFGGTNAFANFNLATGAIGFKEATVEAKIVDLGDGWYYCSIIGTATANHSGVWNQLWLIDNQNTAIWTPTYLGSGRGIWATSIQIENKAYPTSVMPTNLAAGTREADTPRALWPVGLVQDFAIVNKARVLNAYPVPQGRFMYESQTDIDNRIYNTIAFNNAFVYFRKELLGVEYEARSQFAVDLLLEHQYKGRISSTNGVDMWRDNLKGIGDNTNPAKAPVTPGTDLLIGRTTHDGATINGTLKDLAIYDGDLTDAEIFLLDNDDPFHGMGLEFLALVAQPDVGIGIGTMTTNWPSGGYGFNGTTKYFDLYAPNTPAWDGDKLHFMIGATNEVEDSREIDIEFAQNPTATLLKDGVGFDGVPNTAWRITDGDQSNTLQLQSIVKTPAGVAGTREVMVFWINKETGPINFLSGFRMQQGGGDVKYHEYLLNTYTGELRTQTNTGGLGKAEVLDRGLMWKLMIESEPDATNLNLQAFVFPARADLQGVGGGAHTGRVWISNFEVHPNTTIEYVRGLPPVVSVGGVGGVMDKSIYTFDIANHDNDNGVWAIDIVPTWDDAEANNQASVGDGNARWAMMTFNNSGHGAYDGTQNCFAPMSYKAFGVPQTVSIQYHAGDLLQGATTPEGHNEQPYDGAYPISGAVGIGDQQTEAKCFAISNIRRYRVTSFGQAAAFASRGYPTLGATTFIGPNIPPSQFPISSLFELDVSSRFTGNIIDYALVGTWPTGVTVDKFGLMTGTWSAIAGVYAGLTVQAIGTGTADSNEFTIELV